MVAVAFAQPLNVTLWLPEDVSCTLSVLVTHSGRLSEQKDPGTRSLLYTSCNRTRKLSLTPGRLEHPAVFFKTHCCAAPLPSPPPAVRVELEARGSAGKMVTLNGEPLMAVSPSCTVTV